MVKLTDIARDTKTIWCNYHPEGRDEFGFIKVDISLEEIVELKQSAVDNGITAYAHHAMMRLIELKTADELPAITSSIWY